MLISKVPEDDGGKGEGCALSVDNNAHEYQTASELFDFMAKNQNYNTNDGDSLTPRDLILLYKNIDLGTKLMNNVNEFRCERSNQHVETVVYNDDQDSDGSDISDIYSNEDLHNVFLINKERLDLFNNQSSIENTLCHKFGDLEIQGSINTGYDKHYLFNDPFIKEQLTSFNLLSTSNQIDGTVLPASLLDYVCCKRLEDNYNFYMDNIIRYVKNTIEHLKRISNGDYLTDKVKEKWREVENVDHATLNNTKVLATSTSIPLHVECKIGGRLSTWDDIVHSAVDIRSLSKILEKKIVVEIPKLISGSYKLLSKCCRDNLIITCKKNTEEVEESKEPRVDVVFQLKRSKTGHVMSNINSIMILQTGPILQNAPLPLTYNEKETNADSNNVHGNDVIITELNTTNIYESCDAKTSSETPELEVTDFDSAKDDSLNDDDYFKILENSQENRNEYNFASSGINEANQITNTKTFDMCPDYLRMTIHSMSLQSVLPEETTEDISQLMLPRKKSPKVRIKSPYENQSFAMEEKKRRKLLEIRSRREKKKQALAENCKINKHKYGKVAAMPQPSNSVTKLSITNKSFYNSIYGQNADSKQLKIRSRNTGEAKNEIPEVALENLESEHETSTLTPEKDTKKFINRSYYLDDTVTEMMLVNMKQEEEDEDDRDKGTGSASNSSDYRINLNILSQLIATSDSEHNINNEHHDENVRPDETPEQLFNNLSDRESNQEEKELVPSQSALNAVPSNTPEAKIAVKDDNKELKKLTPAIECRKSIDKIYQLMKKLENTKGSDEGIKMNSCNMIDASAGKGSSSIQASDSGTSLKHHLTSSNLSTFSFHKNNNTESLQHYDKPPENVTNVIPKVIISSKTQVPKIVNERLKRERKRPVVSPPKVQENPLKAISQILHEFENVQKNRIKSGREQKPIKRGDTTAMTNERKPFPRQATYKRQSEQHTDSMNRYNRPAITSKDRNTKQPLAGTDPIKNANRQTPISDRYADKNTKKVSDILDEAREARGEAVRGPSKFTARLNSLAQPKRIYVQAHSEDYQTRYGRNLITDRLQRLAAAPALSVDRTTGLANTRNKYKRSNNETMPMKFQPGFPIERQPIRPRYQHSSNSSIDRKEKLHTLLGPPNKPENVAETPEIKKKMVEFEEYVHNQFRPTSFSSVPGELQYIEKTRTPLLPSDIDMGSVTSSSLSAKESTEMGIRLHHIINSIVKTPSSTLEVLDECFENNSKIVKDNNILKYYEDFSLDSDYTTGVTDEPPLALSVLTDDSENTPKEEKANKETDFSLCKIQPFQSVTAMEKEAYGQCHPLPVGVFGHRLKGHSLSRQSSIYLLQSSDVGSIMVKASISQKLKTDRCIDFQIIPSIHKPSMKLSFANIPMQITTVGYAFPEYNSLNCGSPSLCNLLENVSKPSSYHRSLIEKAPFLCDSLRGHSQQDCQKHIEENQTPLDAFVQTDVTNFTELTKALKDTQDIQQKTENDKPQQIILENVTEDKDMQRIVQLEEKHETCTASKNPDSIDFSSSLDILVGLLNEIKNITCQSQLTDNEREESKELETILNKTFTENSIQSTPFDELSINQLSLTSLEKLRSLDSNFSVHSCYLSDNQRIGSYGNIVPDINPWYNTKNAYYKPIYADKEVNVDIVKEDCVNKLTDVPSIYFPITINHSTNVNNLIISEFHTSTRSLVSFADFHSTRSYSTNSTVFDDDVNKIIELPNISNKKEINLILACNKTKTKNEKTNKIDKIKQNKISENHVKGTLCIKSSDFDSVIKLKRDILVTVYSMLVLTVFAALSLPELLYHV